MALPSFLQAMFTPQRPGPGQMAWRDRDVGEGSGEISQGDIQEMYWKRGPAARGHGQQMNSAVRPNPTGSGETIETNLTDIIPDDMGALSSDDDVDMTSITETALEPGGMSSISEVMQGQAGEMSPMGYASPFGDPTADELDVYGINSPPDPGLASTRGKHAEEGPGMFSQGPSMGTIPRHSNAHGFVGGGGGGLFGLGG